MSEPREALFDTMLVMLQVVVKKAVLTHAGARAEIHITRAEFDRIREAIRLVEAQARPRKEER